MTAQLILQFKTAEDLKSFDRLVQFEEILVSHLGTFAMVDGHDFGASQMNIFILTDDPTSTFALVQQTDDSVRPSHEMKAAYRVIDHEEFICLWPPGLSEFHVA